MKSYAIRTNFVTWCQCCSIHRHFWIFMQMCFGHYPNHCGKKYCYFFYALHVLTNIVDVHSECGCKATAKLMKAICDALHSVCSFNRRTFPKWNYFKPTIHSKATFRIENVSITSDKHEADGWLTDFYRLKFSQIIQMAKNWIFTSIFTFIMTSLHFLCVFVPIFRNNRTKPKICI